MIELELLTRPGCQLCEEMKHALEEASIGLEVRLTETNIDDDDALTAEYGNDIPVLLVNGSKAFKHRAHARDLRRRLLTENRKPKTDD